MARPRNLVPSVELRVSIPEDWRKKLDTHLWSEVEDRVPMGAYKDFVTARIREFLVWRGLDLAPYAGSPAGALVVRGEAEAIRILEDMLRDALHLRMLVQKLEAAEEASQQA